MTVPVAYTPGMGGFLPRPPVVLVATSQAQAARPPPRRWGGPHARAPFSIGPPSPAAACAGREASTSASGPLPPVRGARTALTSPSENARDNHGMEKVNLQLLDAARPTSHIHLHQLIYQYTGGTRN